ncbi:MAG: hypothetical protein ACT4O2_02850 [Beijerinckiaceae bacterium]
MAEEFMTPADKRLNRYVIEMTWRFNGRDMKATDRMNDLSFCVDGRMTCKTLIG